MLLITIFVELRVVAGRSRTRAGSPKAVSRRPCRAVALKRTAWSEHGMGMGMASVNQKRPHCANQMGKTHSKPLAAWHGMGTAWARHAMCESTLTVQKSLEGSSLASFPTWLILHSKVHQTQSTGRKCCTHLFINF
jgi:hypothetical protein